MDGFVFDKKNRIDIAEDASLLPGKRPAQNAWSRPASNPGLDRGEARAAEPSRRGEGKREPQAYFEEEQAGREGARGEPRERQGVEIHNEGVISAILALVKELPPAEIALVKRDIARRLGLQ